MKSEYNELWSTPIGKYQLSDDSIHQEVVDALSRKYDTTGQEFNIIKEANCNKFEQWFLEKCNEYASNFLSNSSCSIKRSWITTLQYGDLNHHHQHGDSGIVGVYYINTIPEHPSLQIFDPRIPHSLNAINIVRDGQIICENVRYILIPPTDRTLVLFPGYLLHGVGNNMSKVPRYSLAINVNVKFETNDMVA